MVGGSAMRPQRQHSRSWWETCSGLFVQLSDMQTFLDAGVPFMALCLLAILHPVP